MPDPRDVLKAHGLWARKRFGQNFLVDPGAPGLIATAGGATRADVVFEIGAGVGTLTRALADIAGRVVALEHDADLVPVARAELADLPDVEVREGNVLDIDWVALAAELGGPVVVYGNVPYNLSTQIMVGLLEAPHAWRRVCLLLQREFATRVAAPPGSRRCGALSAQVALRTHATIALEVSPTSFFPVPKVDSSVLVLEPRAKLAVDVGDESTFRKVVRALFAQRRKMARKALKPLCADSEALLEEAGLEPTRRGETFQLEELAALSRALGSREKGGLNENPPPNPVP